MYGIPFSHIRIVDKTRASGETRYYNIVVLCIIVFGIYINRVNYVVIIVFIPNYRPAHELPLFRLRANNVLLDFYYRSVEESTLNNFERA